MECFTPSAKSDPPRPANGATRSDCSAPAPFFATHVRKPSSRCGFASLEAGRVSGQPKTPTALGDRPRRDQHFVSWGARTSVWPVARPRNTPQSRSSPSWERAALGNPACPAAVRKRPRQILIWHREWSCQCKTIKWPRRFILSLETSIA